MLEDRMDQARVQEDDSSTNSFGSKTEMIQRLVSTLVSNYQYIDRSKSDRVSKSAISENDIPGHDLKLYESWLAEAHRCFCKASQQKAPLTYTSEWVLDNYYIIRQALRQIEEDLPSSFYKQLPRLAGGPLKGFPRIYAIAHTIISYQHLLIDLIDLQTILIQFQERVSLTMGELWALPIFLRYGLIEFLSHELILKIHPQKLPDLPVAFPQLPGISVPFPSTETAFGEPAKNDGAANIILSLRSISDLDWSEFFESVSRQEGALRSDPAGIYAQMDFNTRDLYRKELEKLSVATGREENELAETIVTLTRCGCVKNSIFFSQIPKYVSRMDADTQPQEQSPVEIKDHLTFTDPGMHIGEVLFGKGRPTLERQIGYQPNLKTIFNRWVERHTDVLYLSIILFLSLLIFLAFLWTANLPKLLNGMSLSAESALWIFMTETGNAPAQWIIISFLIAAFLIPALSIATSLVNWLITMLTRPHILPKLNFKDKIPAPFKTLIIIPAMISNQRDVKSLVHQLEQHYLGNPEPGLFFALLTDFHDADCESLPEDENLLRTTAEGIMALNKKYAPPSPDDDSVSAPDDGHTDSADIFFFLHRRRLWNSSEKKWMGWERKRGKLHELNLLLRGAVNHTFVTLSDGTVETKVKLATLQQVRYVITLDADTILPRGAACRLAGTLAHPLNQAGFNEKTGQVVSGYTVLQPRIEIHSNSTNRSWFTRFFAGDAGLDLYTLAVSDAYQNLFKEGIYVGKGIYDVDAFMRSVNDHIPENTVLSHDLLEGSMGRAGLVSDITMIEDYPQNYIIQALRQRRWIRGDWQLLPWLFQPERFGVTFSLINRWKMFDNLRRTLLAPSILMIFLLGTVFLPGLAMFWTAIVLLSLGIPIFTGLARSMVQILDGEVLKIALRPLAWNFMRWLLAISFLPYETYFSVDAILTTLYRLFISRSNLLQWTTAAQTARVFGLQGRENILWQKMIPVTVLGLTITTTIQTFWSLTKGGVAPALIYASPVLLLWIFSPIISMWVNQPIVEHAIPLNERQIDLLRRVSRRTWGFFERFVGPEDHWLPPDHYQESPTGAIAHRTSPTNIGLLLTSTLAAYDLGYLDQLGLATRLTTTMETLDQLERFRGHFMNWYDTLNLQPLQPRYISTVDSGNLAASLIVTAQACKTMPDEHIFRWALWQGYLDTLANLTETLTWMRKAEFDQQVEEINLRITAIHAEILAVRSQPDLWYPLYLKVSGPYWQDIAQRLMKLVMVGRSAFNLESLAKLQEFAAQTERHHLAVQRTITELTPWIPYLENIPLQFLEPQLLEAMTALRTCLPNQITFGQVHNRIEQALQQITSLRDSLPHAEVIPDTFDKPNLWPENSARKWLDKMVEVLKQADENSFSLAKKYTQIQMRAELYVNEMNFSFLYHSQRRIFHIGFNLVTGQLDQNYYDLLASEARISSIIAIAKGDAPQSHWLHLGRPVTLVENSYVLLSWSGTMFEYLMPPLFFRSYPGTLLAESTRGAVRHQIAYGKAKGVPWGISESGFYRFDANQNYQYRAFGVPGLGFKRGLGDDLVISPYASLMAIGCDPHAVLRNLTSLIEQKMIGLYGVYESIDFTPDRLLLDETSAVVSEYMAHHQGMILMAITNFLHEDIMIQRLHSDPRIQNVELLLQEQIPHAVPSQNPYAEDVKGVQRLTVVPEEIIPWRVPVQTAIPQVNLLSNGNYNVIISNMGGGYSSWREFDLTRWQPDSVLDPWGTWIYIREPGKSLVSRPPACSRQCGRYASNFLCPYGCLPTHRK